MFLQISLPLEVDISTKLINVIYSYMYCILKFLITISLNIKIKCCESFTRQLLGTSGCKGMSRCQNNVSSFPPQPVSAKSSHEFNYSRQGLSVPITSECPHHSNLHLQNDKVPFIGNQNFRKGQNIIFNMQSPKYNFKYERTI